MSDVKNIQVSLDSTSALSIFNYCALKMTKVNKENTLCILKPDCYSLRFMWWLEHSQQLGNSTCFQVKIADWKCLTMESQQLPKDDFNTQPKHRRVSSTHTCSCAAFCQPSVSPSCCYQSFYTCLSVSTTRAAHVAQNQIWRKGLSAHAQTDFQKTLYGSVFTILLLRYFLSPVKRWLMRKKIEKTNAVIVF